MIIKPAMPVKVVSGPYSGVWGDVLSVDDHKVTIAPWGESFLIEANSEDVGFFGD